MRTTRGYTAALLIVFAAMGVPGYAQTIEQPDAQTIDRVLGQPTAQTTPPAADRADTAPAELATTDAGTIASRERALVLRYRRLRDRAARYQAQPLDRINPVRGVRRPAFANDDGTGGTAQIGRDLIQGAPLAPTGTLTPAGVPGGPETADWVTVRALVTELRSLADRLDKALADLTLPTRGRQ